MFGCNNRQQKLEWTFILFAVLYDPRVLMAHPRGQERPKSRLALWSGKEWRCHLGTAEFTGDPEHPVGTVALGILCSVISSARLALGIAESHSRREPRAPGALGRSQLAADRQALPQPPLYSLPQITVIFFFSSLPMWHFTRNLTDLTSHWEKVYHWGRKPSQPIRFSHTSRLQASCLPGVTRGREEMSTRSAFTFLYNCLCYFHIV